MDTSKKATVAGAVLAALQATTVDYHKLAYFDREEILKLAMACVFGYLGYLTNRE